MRSYKLLYQGTQRDSLAFIVNHISSTWLVDVVAVVQESCRDRAVSHSVTGLFVQ